MPAKGRIFFGLFALPFLGVGIWAFISIVGTLVEWVDMQGWESVQAQVLSGGYSTHSGDDSDTYEAYGVYEYSYHGREYKNDRVMIGSGSDNVGDFQQDLGRKLERAAAQQVSVDAYVNPDNPSEAVISRDIRWGMIGFKSIFMIVFGGFGLGAFVVLLRAPKEKDLTLPIYKESPWLANDDWQGGEIRSNAKSAMYFMWGFTIFWNVICAPLSFLLYDEVREKGNYPALIGLLFPLVGMGLLVRSIRQTLRWKKFGHAPVKLDPFPGSIGGQVGGAIELAYPYDQSIQFVVTLSSIYSYESGSGKNRSRSEKVKWQDTAAAHSEMGIYGTRIIFCFDVPEGLAASDAGIKGSDYYLWRLNLRASVPGIDVDNDYEIPVYPTREKSKHLAERAIAMSARVTQQMDNSGAQSKILIRQGEQGMEMFYPMGRNIGVSLIGMLAGGVFAGIGGGLILSKETYLFGGIFALIGALVFLCALYSCVNSLVVRKDTYGGIETVRRIFGLSIKRRYARVDEIRALSKKSDFSTQSGGRHAMYYSVYAVLQDGKEMVLGEGFHGEGEGDAAIALIRESFGIKASKTGEVKSRKNGAVDGI